MKEMIKALAQPAAKKRKPKRPTQSQMFEQSKSKKFQVSKQLKDHAKLHRGGLKSKHMKNMIKFMKDGDSFSKAHMKAKALDKKKSSY